MCGSVGGFGRTGDLETGGSEAGSGYSVVLDLCPEVVQFVVESLPSVFVL